MTVTWASPGDAAAVAEHIARVVTRPGPKRIAVPGGSTPAKVFAELGGSGLDWSDCEVWLTDDRQVPHVHPASNFGNLHKALGQTAATLVELQEGAATPIFDLVWLGMGTDGHVASLFPRMCAQLHPREARVIETVPKPLPPEAPYPRLSLNRGALNRAREIVLVVTGAEKRTLIGEASRRDAWPVSDFLRSPLAPPLTIYWSP